MKTLLVTTVAILATAACLSVADDSKTAKKAKKKPTVKELMTAAHKSTKEKPSPLLIIETQLDAKAPDWNVLAANTKPLSKLADAIKDVRFGYKGPPGPYVKAVKTLALATKEHDLEKARGALVGIKKSCAACHYYGKS